MALRGRAALLVVVLSAVVAVDACDARSAPPPSDAVPALPPSGPTAHDVDYTCGSGKRDTILLDLPEPERLAEVVNPIDICQYDDGLVEVRVQLNCTPGQPRTDATVRAVDGRLPASTTQTLCG